MKRHTELTGQAVPSEPELRGPLPPPSPHGGDGPAIAAALGWAPEDVLDLSATMNPLAPPPERTLRRAVPALAHYPDPTRARDALAERLGVPPRCLLLTNGGAEAIALVARMLGRARVEEPEFSLWRRHLEAVDPAGQRVRSNPHSPSGRLADPEERAAVWDEAFYPLATGCWTRGDTTKDGTLVVGSLTKLLGLPGLRVGYVLTPDPALSAQLAHLQPAWSVNGLVAAALPELLAPIDLAETARRLADLRAALVRALEDRDLVVHSAAAPWVLVEGAPRLRDRLARFGVVVRDCHSFGLPGTVRIAVPDDAGRARLLAALDAALDADPVTRGSQASAPSDLDERAKGVTGASACDTGAGHLSAPLSGPPSRGSSLGEPPIGEPSRGWQS